jgi:hypothetical protein
VRDDDRPEGLPGPAHADGSSAGTTDEGDAGRDGFDVPEWVSEFRRLYVEPKTRAVVRQEANRRGRRTPLVGPAGAVTPAVGASPVGADARMEPTSELPVQPLSDEPLRSRSELHRSRRASPDPAPARRDRSPGPPSRAAEAGPETASRAALRRAREERAKAERRMRLRRTVVVGVLILAVAAVVTWLVARSHEPVAASASTAALVLPSPATVAAAAVAFGEDPASTAGDAGRAPAPAVSGGGTPAVRVSVPAPSATTAEPSPTATPAPPARGTGRMSWVDWGEVPGTRADGGHVVRVALEIEGGIGVDPAATAETVAGILVGPRGWQERRDVRFVFVGPAQARRGEYDVRIGLASRLTTMELCGPVQTKGFTSCYNGRVVLNLDRWMLAVPAYTGRLDDYRTYVVNHEVGHSFGLGHDGCPRAGQPASVMVPQTLHLWGCLPNPYPVVG